MSALSFTLYTDTHHDIPSTTKTWVAILLAAGLWLGINGLEVKNVSVWMADPLLFFCNEFKAKKCSFGYPVIWGRILMTCA